MKRRTKNSPWYKAQELIARLEGGELTPASGARPAMKGDVRSDSAAYEVKYSEKPSFYLSDTVLRKAIDEALMAAGRSPAVYIVMQQYGVMKLVPEWEENRPKLYSTYLRKKKGAQGRTIPAQSWEYVSGNIGIRVHDGWDFWVGWKIAGKEMII